ncbi:MAG: sulfatase-like hydrolase/transferase [Candidatus Gorgyraea atricola]|nr:sulfatase-like hydrolase/transferase [Candidatus Gorgyraea atricola]
MRYFNTLAPLSALAEAHQLIVWRDSLYALAQSKDTWFLCFPIAVLLFIKGFKFSAKIRKFVPRYNLIWQRIIFFLCIIFSIPAVTILADNINYYHSVGNKPLDGSAFEERGILNWHLFNFYQTLCELFPERELTQHEKEKIRKFFTKRQQGPVTMEMFGCAEGKNLLLIQVEALQQFVIGKQVSGQYITPFLNRLREKGLYFPFIFNQTAGGLSSDAAFIALNSLHPLNQGAVAFRKPCNNFITLPWQLKRAGYATLAAMSYNREIWNAGVIFPHYGFEHSLFYREIEKKINLTETDKLTDRIGNKYTSSDEVLFKYIIPELVKLPRPFFAFLETSSSHHPYNTLPDEYKTLDVGALEGSMLGDYIHFMRYADTCLKRLFRDLDKAGLLDETIVAIYGDHDARLPLNAELRQFTGYTENLFSDEMMKVWLDRVAVFLVLPRDSVSQEPLGVSEIVGGQIDIAPTLLYYLGIEQPKCFIGRPLISNRSDNAVVLSDPMGSVVTDDKIFLSGGTAGLYKTNCCEFPSGAPLAVEAGEILKQKGREELNVSQLVILYDLCQEIIGVD